MSSDFDATEFIDHDLEAQKRPYSTSMSTTIGQRAPSHEEVNSRVAEAQQKLADLKREQEALERERASLEETRRRQSELRTGRQETLEQLARGITLLEEAEFNSRRDAEQMARTLQSFREALAKVEQIQEQGWTHENFTVELSRALTCVEQARMEWNSARLKFPLLAGHVAEPAEAPAEGSINFFKAGTSFSELCRMGFAMTWPVAGAILLLAGILVVFLLRR
jgi:predicted nuclease with TOPRIM domain